VYITEAFRDQNNFTWLDSSLVRAPDPDQEDESSKPRQDRLSNANNVADPGVRSSTILTHKFLINTFQKFLLNIVMAVRSWGNSGTWTPVFHIASRRANHSVTRLLSVHHHFSYTAKKMLFQSPMRLCTCLLYVAFLILLKEKKLFWKFFRVFFFFLIIY
jgi:hypothetical protein